MFNRVFIIDFKKLVAILLITFLRRPKMLAWLRAVTVPVKILHNDFTRNRESNLYKLRHNSQVCSLRKVLNDAFDPQERRIRIENGIKYDREYIYTRGEQKPRYLGVIYLRPRSDYQSDGVNFRVIVPVGFALDPIIHQMTALIDFYKLAGKRYKIQYDE